MESTVECDGFLTIDATNNFLLFSFSSVKISISSLSKLE